MSEPVQCFMLEVVERETNVVTAELKLGRDGEERANAACPAMPGHLHRAEVSVPSGISLSNVITGADDTLYIQLPDRRVQMCCSGCGMVFKADEAEAWSSHAKWWYRNPKTGKEGSGSYQVASPGAMYECPWLDEEDHRADLLSEFYVRDWAGKRLPLAVVLPDYSHWVVDQKSTIRGSNQFGPGWTITGDAPNLTASPSIDTGTYHGFLQNGILTPDLENRVYKSRD